MNFWIQPERNSANLRIVASRRDTKRQVGEFNPQPVDRVYVIN